MKIRSECLAVFIMVAAVGQGIQAQELIATPFSTPMYSDDPPIRGADETQAEYAKRMEQYVEERLLYASKPLRKPGEGNAEFEARCDAYLKTLPAGVKFKPDYVKVAMSSQRRTESRYIPVFHNLFPSLASTLANSPGTGDGWSISAENRKLLAPVLTELKQKRDELFLSSQRELSKDEKAALWAEVFRVEREAEEQICKILDEIFIPEELDHFVQDHSNLAPIIISTKLCCDRLGVDEEGYEWMQSCKVAYQKRFVDTLRISIEDPKQLPTITNKPDTLRVMYKHYGRLNAEQFLESQRILGIARQNETLREFMLRIPEEQREFYIARVPALAALDGLSIQK